MATIGILGGTGPAGRGVAVRLASGGHDVVLGSRDPERAVEVAAHLTPRGSGAVRGAGNPEAALADVVIVATPWESTLATLRPLREALGGKVVVSMVNALVKEGREMLPIYPPRGSVAAHVAALLPTSLVVGAFHHLPAAQMEDLDSGLAADVVIVGDDGTARDRVAELVRTMPGLRPVVAGSLSLASAVEAFTAVCISVNIAYRAHSYVTLQGLNA